MSGLIHTPKQHGRKRSGHAAIVNRTRPWDLANAGDGARLDAVLSALLLACQVIGTRLAPFLPDTATRITRQCAPDEGGLLPSPARLLPRLHEPTNVDTNGYPGSHFYPH